VRSAAAAEKGKKEGKMADQRVALPEQGRPWPVLREEMRAMAAGGLDWRHGRHGAYVWYADDTLEEVVREAYGMFMVENGLNTLVFPGLARMEAEVVAMALEGLGGPGGAGQMSSGGTESIFLAAFAAREWGRRMRPSAGRPNVVAPFSAHPAINKAAHYLGLEVRRVPLAGDFRADPAAMEAAVDGNTIMLYASAPSYSLGVIDPVPALGAVARKHGLWLHVDACVGGILAPFARREGFPVPPFDLSVPGVTSLSADLHKSGFTAKGASLVLFCDEEHREFSRYHFTDWNSSRYSTLTFTGTRPGGAIAAAWAAQNFLGAAGYRAIARKSMQARLLFEQGLQRMDGYRVFGEPDLWALGFGSEEADMTMVQLFLIARGWVWGSIPSPSGLHMMFTPVHHAVVDDMLAALRDATADAKNGVRPPAELLALLHYS
jgi:glutamate/tyrosine decarboxylase-like PLP-dependent enzyme